MLCLYAFQLDDFPQWILGFEYVRARNKDIGSMRDKLRGCVAIYATVNLYECIAATVSNELAKSVNFLISTLYELLPSKARVYAH